MNDIQTYTTQATVQSVWQLCQRSSDLHGIYPPVYPENAPLLEVEGLNVANWIALPRFDEFHTLNGIAFFDLAGNRTATLGLQKRKGDHLQIPASNTVKENDAIYVGDCPWQGILISTITGCATIIVDAQETAHIVRKIGEKCFDPRNICIFNHPSQIEDTKLIAEQRGCSWINIDPWIDRKIISDRDLIDLEKLKARIKSATEDHNYINRNRPPLSYPVSALEQRQPLSWIVKGIISDKSFNAIYGASKAGKTFVALDLAAAISTGKKWMGNKVQKRPVLYMALESSAGFVIRTRAHMKVHGHDSIGGLHTWFDRFSFSNPSDVSKLIDHLIGGGFEGGVVFIDTLARAMAGLDENSGTDMGKMIDICAQITKKTGCAIILVHHSGKNQQSGLRGHSMLMGALDSAIEVRATGDVRLLYMDKIKEGSDGMEYPFQLNVISLGEDEDGAPVNSCTVQYMELQV